jgi:hypothetical protein
MAMIKIFRNEELKRMDWKMVLQVCVYARARARARGTESCRGA